jgi:hypothetical protein
MQPHALVCAQISFNAWVVLAAEITDAAGDLVFDLASRRCDIPQSWITRPSMQPVISGDKP